MPVLSFGVPLQTPPPCPSFCLSNSPYPYRFFFHYHSPTLPLKRIYCLFFFFSFFFLYFFNVRCFCFFSRCSARIGSLSSRDFISFSGETPVMQGRERIQRKEWGSLLVRGLSWVRFYLRKGIFVSFLLASFFSLFSPFFHPFAFYRIMPFYSIISIFCFWKEKKEKNEKKNKKSTEIT